MKDNYGWLLLGGSLGMLIYSVCLCVILSIKIDSLNEELLSVKFDQDVCTERVTKLSAHEREPKK
jgi:hypothetical protein